MTDERTDSARRDGLYPHGARFAPLLVCAMFFLSGMAALVFENLWFRLAGLAFGNTVWASALVLSSFMGGLALGNALAASNVISTRNPVRLYGLMEVVVAVTGLGLVLGFPALTKTLAPLFGEFLDRPYILNPLRLGVGFLLLIIPTTAMGTTLPLLVKTLKDRDPRFGVALGRLYGWNTFGAVVGALLPEALLIERIGISGAGLVACMINVTAASGAFLLAYLLAPSGADSAESSAGPIRPLLRSVRLLRLMAAGFLCGAIVLGLEVIWFRTLLLYFNAYSIVFAVMLAVVLAGIALGGMLGSWVFRAGLDARENLAGLALLTGIACIGSYLAFGRLPAAPLGGLFPWADMLTLCACLIFPTCLLSGTLFTFIGEGVYQEIRASIQTTGALTMANTLGGMFGALVAAFALLPGLGMEKSLFLLAACYGLVAILSLDAASVRASGPRRVLVWGPAIGFAAALALFPFGAMRERILSVGERHLPREEDWRVVGIREGLTETIHYWERLLLGKRVVVSLFTNNHPMSGTRVGSQRYMKHYVYLPVAIHPDPKDALLICFGVGSTAQALTGASALRSIDVVDISQDILENSKIVFPDPVANPLNDPRVRVHVEDGRFFLATTSKKYDLITAEPPPPLAAGVVNLYSREYFSLIHNRLREGGWVTYWLPVGQIPWSGVKSIVKGFCEVFDDCSLWTGKGLEWTLVGIRKPFSAPGEERFSAQWRDPKVAPELRGLGFEVPELLGATFLMDAATLKRWASDTQPLVDNFPYRIFGTGGPDEERAVTDLEDLMSPLLARDLFRSSPLIDGLWPRSARERTVEYFPLQALINEPFLKPKRSRSAPDLKSLHAILTSSTLRSPVIWLMGGPNMADDDLILDSLDQEAVRRTAGLNFHLAARALGERDYVKAQGLFEAEENLTGVKDLTLYRAYCLCMLQQKEDAARFLVERRKALAASGLDIDRTQLQWLQDTFDLPPGPLSR